MLASPVLLKFIAIAFVALSAVRVLLPARWVEFGRFYRRFVDLTLVLLALTFGTQLLLIALR